MTLYSDATLEKVINWLYEEYREKRERAVQNNNKEDFDYFQDMIDALSEIASFDQNQHNGNIYFVDIPENDILLDWDADLSEQPEKVKKSIRKVLAKIDKSNIPTELAHKIKNAKTGEEFYHALEDAFEHLSKNGQRNITRPDMATSMLLHQAGIPGLRYFDQVSRDTKSGTRNFVIWNTDMIKLLGLTQDSDENAKQYFREQKAKSPNNSESYKQIIGVDGAKRLDVAEGITTRMDYLRIARHMERNRLPAAKIWVATGWTRGAEGKWRYEISNGKINRKKLDQLRKIANKFKALNDFYDNNPNHNDTQEDIDGFLLPEHQKRNSQFKRNSDLNYLEDDYVI